jgi:hypothetical protein
MFADALPLLIPVEIYLFLQKGIKVLPHPRKAVGNHGLSSALLDAPQVFLIIRVKFFFWGRTCAGCSGGRVKSL